MCLTEREHSIRTNNKNEGKWEKRIVWILIYERTESENRRLI